MAFGAAFMKFFENIVSSFGKKKVCHLTDFIYIVLCLLIILAICVTNISSQAIMPLHEFSYDHEFLVKNPS